MPPLTVQDSDENKMWLRQRGSVKEFNVFFNDATHNIQLPERYLVMTYVVGLKKEIAYSVRLFYPLTMQQARSIARAEEIFLQRRLEKARRVLKDQEDDGVPLPSIPKQPTIIQEAPKVQESGGSCSTNTKEEEARCVAHTQRQKEARNVIKMPSWSLLGPSQSASSATDLMEDATKKNKATKMNSGRSEFPPHELVSKFRTPETWKNAKVASVCSGSQRPHSKGSTDHQFSSVLSSSASIFSEQGSTVSPVLKTNGLGNSSSSLPSLAVSGCFLPLNLISSSLSQFIVHPSVRESLQIEKGHCVSRKSERVAWQAKDCVAQKSLVLGVTWLSEDQLEKSKPQLVSTFPTLQLPGNFSMWQKNVDGLQLDGILFQQQKHLNGTMGLIISDMFMGLEDSSEQKSPITLHVGYIFSMGFLNNRLLQGVSFLQFSPTQVVLI